MDLFGPSALSENLNQSPIGDLIVEQGVDIPEHIECVGHDEIERRIVHALNNERLPHAVVFSGMRGIGKFHMALKLARCVLSLSNQGDGVESLSGNLNPLTVHRIANNAHPDFLCVTREYDEKKNRYKDNVAVDAVRRVPTFLQRTASEGGWRVVIVDDADTMNRSAQNAILKILEEPPKKTLLILVVHRMGALLPTIRSRVQVYDMEPLSDTQIAQIIDEHIITQDIDEDILNIALKFAEGSAAEALDFINNGGSDIFNMVRDHVFGAIDWSARHAVAESLGRGNGAQNDYALFMRIVLWLCGFAMRCKAIDETCLPQELLFLNDFMNAHDLEKLIGIYDQLQVHVNMIQNGNLDKRQGVLGAFTIIEG